MINEQEAQCYSLDLQKIITELGTNIWDEVPDAMKNAIQNYKEALAAMVPGLDAADPNAVLKAVKDQVVLSLCPHTDENEWLLESIVPDEDIPTVVQVFQTMEDPKDIPEEDRASCLTC